jgi:hypothetical protein
VYTKTFITVNNVLRSVSQGRSTRTLESFEKLCPFDFRFEVKSMHNALLVDGEIHGEIHVQEIVVND